jgi:hypothetical protein
MKSFSVDCWSAKSEPDQEPCRAVVIAPDVDAAIALCKAADANFTRFSAEVALDACDGPARLRGFTGQKDAFSWRP